MTKSTKAVSFHSPKIAVDISAYKGKITVLKRSLKGMPMKQRAIVRFREEQHNA
jgi:hypothetical protein|tara:strand:- start:276 stop:437 length:162 start_codon:yes stop_codon:yes gene_type:complete